MFFKTSNTTKHDQTKTNRQRKEVYHEYVTKKKLLRTKDPQREKKKTNKRVGSKQEEDSHSRKYSLQ